LIEVKRVDFDFVHDIDVACPKDDPAARDIDLMSTLVPTAGEQRRCHIHDSQFSKALRGRCGRQAFQKKRSPLDTLQLRFLRFCLAPWLR
jgi:hypothetical protein